MQWLVEKADMIGKDDIEQYVADKQNRMGGDRPIYQIMMIEYAALEDLETDLPTYETDHAGFFYDLQDAIDAMHENACDLRETIFDAGFILVLFPGLYESSFKGTRMYFE